MNAVHVAQVLLMMLLMMMMMMLLLLLMLLMMLLLLLELMKMLFMKMMMNVIIVMIIMMHHSALLPVPLQHDEKQRTSYNANSTHNTRAYSPYLWLGVMRRPNRLCIMRPGERSGSSRRRCKGV